MLFKGKIFGDFQCLTKPDQAKKFACWVIQPSSASPQLLLRVAFTGCTGVSGNIKEQNAMAARSLLVSFFILSFAVIVPKFLANSGVETDGYWKKREEEASKNNLAAYDPHPEAVTDDLNFEVGKLLKAGENNTRRNLMMKYKGPCWATNPIDKCWRCDKNWAKYRYKLADCALGFGRKATGGKHGQTYVVTDSSDDNPVNPKIGTLRHAVIQKEPLWITFSQSMVIKLSQELLVASDKTIDGRGFNVHIAHGAGVSLHYVKNIIISNIHIHDIVPCNGGMIRDSVDHFGLRTKTDGDGISIFGSSNIWIDHVSMSRCTDGLIDAIMGSTAITISNCHFTQHNEVMLFGASDSYSDDEKMQITVAFNHFGHGLTQRMPRCRWGFFHVVNNDYTHWLKYAIGGSKHPTIISQGNRFIAPPDPRCKEVTKRDYALEGEWKKWTWRSEGDLMMNGAFFVESGSPNHAQNDLIPARPGTEVTTMTRFAGPLSCREGSAC